MPSAPAVPSAPSSAPHSMPGAVPSVPSMPSMPSARAVPAWLPPPSYEPPSYEPPTRTDTTSVAGSSPRLPLPKRGPHPAIIALVSGGAALALVVTGVGILRGKRAAPSSKVAAVTTSAVPMIDPPTPARPPLPWGVAAPPPTSTGAVPLTVHASAPIAVLRVGGRAVPIDRPTRDLDVPLETADREKGGRIDAIASDGREARVTFAPNAVTLKLDFPPPRAAYPTPQAAPAPQPATPKHAPLAPDPYGR
jgi:hypothetical protein